MHRFLPWLMLVSGCAACAGAHGQTLLDTCHATSTYDVTFATQGVLFDRAQPAPRRVYLHDGQLQVDGVVVQLDAEDRDRVTLIGRTVHELEPKVKAIATQAVDLAAQAVREQAGGSDADAQLDARIASMSAQLKTRIARSNSSHDWHGPAFDQYANEIAAYIVPLLAGGLLRQAVAMALDGDLEGAAQLRQRAADMGDELRERVRRKLQALRPQVAALCPSLQHIDQWESGIHGPLPGGVQLDLVDIAASR